MEAAASAARATYERGVEAGEILVREGGEEDGVRGGQAATSPPSPSSSSSLFIVKAGTFEVLERRAGGAHIRVALKGVGDAFGEAGLLLPAVGRGQREPTRLPLLPPTTTATVAATSPGAVWVLERAAFRRVARAAGEARTSEVGLFLNAVPALARLGAAERAALALALRPATHPAGTVLFREGDRPPTRPGDPAFFIIRDGEAVVHARAATGSGAAGAVLAAGGRSPEPVAAVGAAAAATAGAPAPAPSTSSALRAIKLNHLFRGDCFGETALLDAAPSLGAVPRRAATVEAATDLALLTLDARAFLALVAPAAAAGLAAAKAPPAVAQRLLRLHAKGAPAPLPATVLLHRLRGPPRAPAGDGAGGGGHGLPAPPPSPADWEVVRARGHLDEVMELVAAADAAAGSEWPPGWPRPPGLEAGRGGTSAGGGGCAGGGLAAANALATPRRRSAKPPSIPPPTLTLVEGPLLGGGAFARVTAVAQHPGGRAFALKRMPKAAVSGCPEHVFCEQAITRNAAHPLCVRQYASFQDATHLYMLFDCLPGGDLMDVLVAEARVVAGARVPRLPPSSQPAAAAPAKGAPPPPPWWVPACLRPRTRLLRGMPEATARFYAACVVEALAYLHARGIVYRDLKPENVLVDAGGYARLGDFGFAKALDPATGRTYTFCGTPGYVAPENVLAQGYGPSVDWWGLGVLVYVLLTGRQPFSSPRTDDPMAVMRRIVDEGWGVPLPPYLSPSARDLLARLLERKPGQRLGCGPGGAGEVRAHKWFAGVDWGGLAGRRVAPPRLPRPSDVAKRLADLAAAEAGRAEGGGGGGKAKENGKAAKEAADAAREADAVFADF